MTIGRKLGIAAGTVILGAGLSFGLASSSNATTSSCYNIAHPGAVPIGCGGIYLPMMGSGTQPNSTSLTLTASADTFNAKVVVDPYDPSSNLQDFTVFEVCNLGNVAPVSPSASSPCGTGGSAVKNPIDGNAEYVAMLTPDGQFVNNTPNDPGNLCLSVDKVRRTVSHHQVWRWVTLLRSCQANGGATFTQGRADGAADNGTPGVVGSANPWQVWSPITSGTSGYVLAEDFLSQNFHNTPYVLDDAGFGGAGTQQLAYPEKDPSDSRNQVWKVIGCTNPVTSLTPGFFNCP